MSQKNRTRGYILQLTKCDFLYPATVADRGTTAKRPPSDRGRPFFLLSTRIFSIMFVLSYRLSSRSGSLVWTLLTTWSRGCWIKFRSEVRNARVEDPVLDSDRRETMWGATRPLRLRFVWLQSCEAFDAVFRRHGCARRRDQYHSRLGDRQYREVYRASHTSAAGRHVNLGRKYPPSRETIHHAEHAHVHESAQAKQRADCRRGSRHRQVIDYIYYLEH